MRAFQDETIAILKKAEALLDRDHFVYINGYHGEGWVNKDAINIDPQLVNQLAKMLAELIANWDCDWICGPATGGMLVAQWTAFHAGKPAAFAEHSIAKAGELRGKFVLNRGFDEMLRDQRVVIVDDVVNTGHSLEQTRDAVLAVGGKAIGIAAYVDRGNVTDQAFGGTPFSYLAGVEIPSWPEEQCPPEILARPINTHFAHGADYLARKAKS